MRKIFVILFLLISFSAYATTRDTLVSIPYGDMEHWIERSVTDSKLLGGKTHTMYEVSGGVNLPNNTPYVKAPFVPWASSNTMADVGIVKGSSTVSKEKRDDGYCAKLMTKLEVIRVIGLFNINVIAAGTLYLGDKIEPILSVDNAISHLCRGIKTDVSPESIIFDYKYHSTGKRYYANGVGAPKITDVDNLGEVIVFLQKRWEDPDGNIYAIRIATAIVQLQDTKGEWVNGFELPLVYGDISKSEIYDVSTELLSLNTPGDFRHFATNSKGEQKQIIEVGFGDIKMKPTHLFVSFSSSQSGAFVGAPGSVLWLDNVKKKILKNENEE